MTHKQSSETIRMWPDGSVRPSNPGPHGGWGVILEMPAHGGGIRYRAMSGYVGESTNNRSELFALINGLKVITRRCRIILRADSRYVLDKVFWMKKHPESLKYLKKKNPDLWEVAKPYIDLHDFTIDYVRGHSDVILNEWADTLAYNATVRKKATDELYDSIPIFKKLKPPEEE
jgi:ribonuclease HI